MRRGDGGYRAMLWWGNLLLVLAFCRLAGGFLGGSPFAQMRNSAFFLPLLLALPLAEILRRRWQGANLLRGLLGLLAVFVLTGGACILALWAGDRLEAAPMALIGAAAAAALFGFAGVQLEFPRTLGGCVLIVVLLVTRLKGPAWEQALLGTLGALFLITGLWAMTQKALRVEEDIAVSASMKRGNLRLMILFLLGVAVMTVLVWCLTLIPLPRPQDPEIMPPEEAEEYLMGYLAEDLKKFNRDSLYPRVAKVLIITVLAVSCLVLLIDAVKKLLRRALRNVEIELPWRRPDPESSETVDGILPQEEGFGRWLRRKLREAAETLRPKPRLDGTAPAREQVRFVYRMILQERAPRQPELLRRTPDELADRLEQERDQAQHFAAAYNRARYSQEPMEEDAAQTAQRLYEQLREKRKRKR